jgi:P-type Ca2+ transporter type 2C
LAQRWLGLDDRTAVTISFSTLVLCQLSFPFSLRNPRSGVVRNEVTRNPWMWGAFALCVLLLIAAVYLPGLSDLLDTRPPPARGWGLIVGLGAIPMIVGQITRVIQRRTQARGARPAASALRPRAQK